MKNKLYYILFILYALMVGTILYINGVFTGEVESLNNLIINLVFLLVIGILFVISAGSFGRLNRCTDALVRVSAEINREYEKKQDCLWDVYRDKKTVFENQILDGQFNKFRIRMKKSHNKNGQSFPCDLEDYINEDLLDQIGMSHFNSGISGTLTGLGILGTFIGLSMGLMSFTGNNIFTISDNVGSLLEGMKVAFHTSVYGIFFSLVFSFIYRGIMADAYGKLSEFLTLFQDYAMPLPVSSDENARAMLIYQANIANYMKAMTELMKGNAVEQVKGVEQIVDRFTKRMTQTLGTDLENLGNTLHTTCQAQKEYTDRWQGMEEATKALLEAGKTTLKAVETIQKQQGIFAGELQDQKEKLAATCDGLNDEIGSQLYTYQKMREDREDMERNADADMGYHAEGRPLSAIDEKSAEADMGYKHEE